VFQQIDLLARIKNTYQAPLHNIEEILSILDMRARLSPVDSTADFIEYLKSVILHYTPAPEAFSYGPSLPGNWEDFITGPRLPLSRYGAFAASLLNLVVQDHTVRAGPGTRQRFSVRRASDSPVRYAVVTVNYDTLLENIALFFSTAYAGDVRFTRANQRDGLDWDSETYLAKLHGSVDESSIVPPTWNKVLNAQIISTWRLAFRVLRDATQLRVLGYSLPDTDTYVRYLLKAAALDAPHLKNVDVLCLDPDGRVEQRYDDFVTLPTYRFANIDLMRYLEGIERSFSRRGAEMTFDGLESLHTRLFG
jgi:hypothetical protein